MWEPRSSNLRERRRRHHMSVWEQRTSQLRRHMQNSSQEAINKEEPPLLNPHASIFRRRKLLENSGLEKNEGEQGSKADRTQGEDSEQPVVGSNPCPSIREDQRTPSPRAKREWEEWHHKSFHGNCGLADQEGGGSVAFEERARLRQSQRRSRHRRVRTEAKENRSTIQETCPEGVSPAEGGEQKKNEEEKQALIEEGQVSVEELKSTNEVPANDSEFAVSPQEPNPAESHEESFKGKDTSPTEQDGSSLDTSEQALLGDLPMDTCRTISRSEPDLSSITTNTEKATESTTIMIDVQDSAVVQSEDLSLFLSAWQ
uniref:Uncharacterized protein n=1 Tax=Sphaerodactylus townsendi TaxID=933632 RepID=A0ACB8F2U2_9SAUR